MAMDRTEMLRLFEAHREAEAARDIEAILETFVADCFLETMPLGLRSERRDAVRAEMQPYCHSSRSRTLRSMIWSSSRSRSVSPG